MVVNFRARILSQDTRKLTQIFIIIIIKKNKTHTNLTRTPFPLPHNQNIFYISPSENWSHQNNINDKKNRLKLPITLSYYYINQEINLLNAATLFLIINLLFLKFGVDIKIA